MCCLSLQHRKWVPSTWQLCQQTDLMQQTSLTAVNQGEGRQEWPFGFFNYTVFFSESMCTPAIFTWMSEDNVQERVLSYREGSED